MYCLKGGSTEEKFWGRTFRDMDGSSKKNRYEITISYHYYSVQDKLEFIVDPSKFIKIYKCIIKI